MAAVSPPADHPTNGLDALDSAVQRTKILLLGLRRCVAVNSSKTPADSIHRAGKTSILEVLFNQLPPKQTFYLETTMRIVKHQVE